MNKKRGFYTPYLRDRDDAIYRKNHATPYKVRIGLIILVFVLIVIFA